MSEETEVVEGEASAAPAGPTYTEAEQRAMDLGWKPKEKWVEDGHEEADHRSAKDFLERGEMIGKLRNQDKELRETRVALESLSKQTSKLYERGYEQAISDLKVERRQALEDGDLVKADELGEKITETKAALEQAKATKIVPKSQSEDPDFTPWLEANPWYQNKTMQKFADALGIEFAEENRKQGIQVSMNQVRSYVAKTVKEEFPHRFKKGDEVRGAPNPDGNGRSTGKESGNSSAQQLSKVEQAMSEDERQIMKTILRANKELTKEKYLKMYADAPSRRG